MVKINNNKKTVMHPLLKWRLIKSLLMATAINFQSASNFNRGGDCIIYAYFFCTHAIIITSLSHFPQRGLHELQGSFMLFSPRSTFNIHSCAFRRCCKVGNEVAHGTSTLNFFSLPSGTFASSCRSMSVSPRSWIRLVLLHAEENYLDHQDFCVLFFFFAKLNGNALDFC